MDQYFLRILDSLSNDDLVILRLLNESNAIVKLKAIKKKYVFEMSGLSEAIFRKVVYKLEGIQFIELIYGGKEHKLVLTEFGQKAIQQLKLEKILN